MDANRGRSRQPSGGGETGTGLPRRLGCKEYGHYASLDRMDDQVYNIAEAKMHLSRLVERVERGERITIARNNRPVAVVSPAHPSPDEALARIDAVRERIRERNGGRAILRRGETWRDLINDGRRV